MTLYMNLAELLGTRIEQGFYRPGDRLPSVRALSVEHGVSLSTVQQAYRLLEDNGLATPKPKSGYFVPVGRELPALPEVGRPAQRPVDISQWDQVLELIRATPRKDVIQMGRGMPDVLSPTLKPLLRSLARVSRRQDLPGLYYDNILGCMELREQIARLSLDSGCQLTAEDIVITTGCHEALSASIHAICEPGDIVAVDSPSFHGAMQTLKGLGMKALEIPTDPITGISLEALELALEQWPIKVIQLTPNCNNPWATSCRRRASGHCSPWRSASTWRSSKTMCTANWPSATRARAPSSLSTKTVECCCAARFRKPWHPVCALVGWHRADTLNGCCT